MKIAVTGATGTIGHHIVEELKNKGHNVIPISRTSGADVIKGEGLAEAFTGVECVIDAANSPAPDEKAATNFFTTAARNLQKFGKQAGVKKIVVVSIIGIDRFSAGYMSAKLAHEKTLQSGPIPVQVVRAAQFHELVSKMIEWGRKDDVSYVQKMKTHLVSAKSVAEVISEIVSGSLKSTKVSPNDRMFEVAGPKLENIVDAAKRLVAHRGDQIQIEPLINPDDPDRVLYETDGLLPGRDAIIVGPTFDEWLATV